ncbi:hypothetical protein E4U57_001849 [Claviceps arundinis]|uniref:Uncharacterized protein n=1 Tax=Claviceps arundinis TaxID=1623583 RepID=A0A9P7STS6_9HYPO|nr:hypothetical protein E4U57_001849 [Claviceps arundinis]KAG5977066.1 hypothetical protein E4U56_000469 [Claviceps arundinis]
MSAPASSFDAFISAHGFYFIYPEESPDPYTPVTDFGTMDGLNECRTARVAEVLADFRTLQFYISSAPSEPQNAEETYTEGWETLRQCVLDGHHILECAADMRVPVAEGGDLEQTKAELRHVLLDAYSRRHEGQKIYLRQGAAQRWVRFREAILQGQQQPYPSVQEQLQACDVQLQEELSSITDEAVYAELASSDHGIGRWTVEDPSLQSVQAWLRERPRLQGGFQVWRGTSEGHGFLWQQPTPKTDPPPGTE